MHFLPSQTLIYLLKVYSPINHTGSPLGFSQNPNDSISWTLCMITSMEQHMLSYLFW